MEKRFESEPRMEVWDERGRVAQRILSAPIDRVDVIDDDAEQPRPASRMLVPTVAIFMVALAAFPSCGPSRAAYPDSSLYWSVITIYVLYWLYGTPLLALASRWRGLLQVAPVRRWLVVAANILAVVFVDTALHAWVKVPISYDDSAMATIMDPRLDTLFHGVLLLTGILMVSRDEVKGKLGRELLPLGLSVVTRLILFP